MNEDISRPHTGKDLVAKILTNTFGAKSFAVYGLNLPAIKAYLPTELPKIEGTDRFADHVFEFEDGSYGIVDYESKYLKANKIKYLEYATRLARKYFSPSKDVKIRIIVIYTCDVESADDTLDLGAVTLKIEQAFLSHIDGEEEYRKIRAKVDAEQKLTDEELMKLVILPMTVKGIAGKSGMIDRIIETGKILRGFDEASGNFALSAMTIAVGDYMTKIQKERLLEVIRMTMIGQMLVDDVERETKFKERFEAVQDGGMTIEYAAKKSNLSIADFALQMEQNGYKVPEGAVA